MKKVLVCALAALMLMTTCMSALASTPLSYITTTSYVVDGSDTKLQVKTTVSNASANEMLTYLAHTEATPTDDTIVYIDQQTADGSTPVEFSYTTTKVANVAALAGVTVKSGSSALDSANNLTTDTINAKRVITVTYDSQSDTLTLPTEQTNAIYPVEITIPANMEISSAKLGDIDVMSLVSADNGAVSIKDDALFMNASNTIVITATPKERIESAVSSVIGKSGRFKYVVDDPATDIDETTTPVEKLTMFGKAITDIDSNFGGMIVTTDSNVAADNNAFVLGANNVTDYPAINKSSDGYFAVQLLNVTGEKDLTNGGYYARIYVRNYEGTVVYSDTVAFEAVEEPAE